MSILEISHRLKEFDGILEDIKSLLRELTVKEAPEVIVC